MVSFIIPAHNEERLIGQTLAALHSAAPAICPSYEIVVVDDASSDRTAEIADRAGARVVTVHKRQISAVRNAGARAARGDTFVFVDADTVVPARTLRAAMGVLRRGCIGGGAAASFDGQVPLYAHLLLESFILVFRFLRLTGGCFLFCTRQAYEAAGGWEETVFAGEEILMCQALKRHGRFVIVPQRVVTSGRKLRSHTAREVLGTMFRVALRGQSALRSRDGLEIWYGQRRPDPHHGP